MNPLLRDLRDRSLRPNRLPDTVWLDRFLARDDGREPILLGLGERWEGTPPALLAGLASAPAHSHGYQLSMFGLPRLRALLRDYVRDTHRLAAFDEAYEVAVSWTGTRSVMKDFGQLVAARGGDTAAREALVVAPAWDYAGILEPAGFTPRYLDVSGADGWTLEPEHIEAYTAGLQGPLSLVVINAQHNPTGLNWSPQAVRALLRTAVEHQAAVLIDDAYYGYVDPADEPTSAIRELLSSPAASELTWLAVRSLGKQFNCNGWAIGSVTAPPAVLDELVNDYRAEHTYNHGAHLQHAMADWLADRGAVDAFLAREREEYAERRRVAVEALEGHGVKDVLSGPAGPYLLYPVPAAFGTDRMAYLERCAVEAGVLMSDTWPAARLLEPRAGTHIRMYLGRPPEEIAEACARLAEAGLLGGGPQR